MKYLRYYILFGVTAVISLFLIFYNPYLGVYEDRITIEYDTNEEGYSWEYKKVGSSLKEESISDNKWTFKVNKKGVTELWFTYNNDVETKYSIYYKFKVRGKKILWIEGYGEGLIDYPNPS